MGRRREEGEEEEEGGGRSNEMCMWLAWFYMVKGMKGGEE